MFAPSCAVDTSIVPGDRGRRRLRGPPDGFVAEAQRTGRRPLRPVASGYEKTGGKKFLAPRPSAEAVHGGRRHNRDQQMRSGFHAPETIAWEKKKNDVMWGSTPARAFMSEERTLEVEFGMKRMVPTTAERRNGIGSAGAPGDKAYATVECAPDFYKQEGLVAGACIEDCRAKFAAHRSSADDRSAMSASKLYELKKRRELAAQEMAQVAALRDADDGHSDDDDDLAPPRAKPARARSPRFRKDSPRAAPPS